MLRTYKYSGSISSLSGDYREIVLYNMEHPEIAPTKVDGCLFKDYFDKVEFCDDEERYLPHLFVYDQILMLNEIHVLTRDGKDAKIIVGGIDNGYAYCRIFGPKENITSDDPERISAEEYQKYLDWKSDSSSM